MKKSLVVTIVIIVVIALLAMWGINTYNTIQTKEQSVDNSWSKVESAYQRRSDLIGNLVNTVKGYANFEQKTLTDVIQARANASSVKIDPTNMTAEQVAQYQKSQGELNSALSRLLVTVEQYPNLKANENFLQLQNQIEQTENNIKIERDNFNNTVQDYNNYVVRFPVVMFGADKKVYFKSDAGAEKAPTVKFE